MKTQFINLAGDDVFPIVGWLVFLNGPQKFKTHKLGSGVTKIGTGKESDIVISAAYWEHLAYEAQRAKAQSILQAPDRLP